MRTPILIFLVGFVAWLATAHARALEPHPGEKIYREKCARCHGAAGEGTEDRLSIWPHVAALPPKQRAVIVLRYYEDLTEQQIADALGCSPGTVKSNASLALKSLRARMEGAHS